MSSIFGRINFEEKDINAADMAVMEQKLNHWKADARDVVLDGRVGFGQLMLYNTQGSLTEKLPLKQDNLLITADARLDNRADICRLLAVKDDETETPDSQLILELYRKYGADCINHIIGDFAFAIYDKNEQKLFCARDQMGVKPFFYTVTDTFFAFASEKKGLLVIPGVDKTLNEPFLYRRVMNDFYELPTTTLYTNIHRLAAAHTLSLHIPTRSIQLRNYWTLDAEAELKLKTKEDYYEGLRHYFDEAVKCRLRSVYAVGSELSGGLDSSAIVGAANKYTSGQIITFSNTLASHITDEESLRMSERKFIEDVIKYLDIKDSILITEDPWKSPVEEADVSIDINDGLEMWNPHWQMGMKKAVLKRDVRTLLSGFPGDEMVTYKGQHHYLQLWDDKKYIAYLKGIRNYKSFRMRTTPFVPDSINMAIHKVANMVKVMGGLKNETPIEIPVKYKLQYKDNVWHNQHFLDRFKSYRHFQASRLLQPRVELRMESETRFGMYYRHEPRFPMADIRLTQYYLSIPNHLKQSPIIDRYLYRQAVKEYLPESVYNRVKKQGVMAPFFKTEERKKARAENIREIFSELKEKKHLPLVLKTNKIYDYGSIEILRWLEKLPYLQ